MVGIAVLGAGRIGKIHAANVAANPSARLIAVADPYASAAQSLAGSLGADAMTDCEAAIDRNDVDAIIIGTPTDTHIQLMMRAVRQGKAVLCEKPIDLDILKSQAAVDEIEGLKGRVMLAFNRRFDTTFAAMKLAIDAGAIGDVRQVIITSRDPGLAPEEYIRHSGGIFRDMTIHDLDLGRWLLGEEPVELIAMGSRLVDAAMLSKYDDYDTAMVQMKTASGTQCHVNNCRHAVYGYDQRVEVFGSKGMLAQDNQRASSLRISNHEFTDAHGPLLNFFLERYQQAYKSELDAFIDALVKEKAMPVTPRDGLRALQLAEGAVESVRSGRAVPV
ncbi:inositol 2-dehydrogenase [Pseudomonas sp. CBSPBW29]|uniref:inositol 2-dehydrogenase n=1 Tax=Pseudomonas sp. CBS TaxID=2971912 RepID=UPI0021ABEF9A|nr:inositol 2-dehydrogenase [Pseudomonas sp. CBS]WEL43542.1 inositol 2-dehydrogenase [Pseudomonas sp. CBSPBW29]WEL64614.1 inositol 2-dehydrogenase [Pseudomonas sp. CBSPGW29]WEL68079.1 inositol 2-dehydrogenase [Pseudomonas sp. CBSPCGW29]WEL75103.1 inositol 2-dehydrogenase [Pseudomonas sp. CBSPAW29]WEL80652.1 inositol 2-dehydrogenase [Pseudomonas sp. CBSPCAW29]WEL89168.1 inositol 2-dehydrogenase [Pseudomonas sp. CBSPCBW29]